MAPKKDTGKKKMSEAVRGIETYQRKTLVETPVAFTEKDLKDITRDYEDVINEKQGEKKGAFAKIFRGYMNNFTVQVAVKKYPSTENHQYVREKSVFMTTCHPNILRLFGFRDQSCELVLEYLPSDLQDFINDRDETLEASRIANIAQQIAKAIRYMNEEKSIDIGDLSADNVLIDKNNRDQVMLCDFGGSSQMGKALGTYSPYYTAPESQAGSTHDKSDIYSLGVIMIQMIFRRSAKEFGRTPTKIQQVRRQLAAAKNIKANKEESEKIHITLLAKQPQLKSSWLKDREERQYASLIDLAIKCTQFEAGNRPKIADIIQELNNINGSAGRS